MKKIKKIITLPRVMEKIEQTDCEDVFWLCSSTLIQYEDGSSKKGRPVEGKFYRRCEPNTQDGIVFNDEWYTEIIPTSFSVPFT